MRNWSSTLKEKLFLYLYYVQILNENIMLFFWSRWKIKEQLTEQLTKKKKKSNQNPLNQTIKKFSRSQFAQFVMTKLL